MPKIPETRPLLPKHPTKFMHRLRYFMRQKGLAAATEKSYCAWIKRFIKYHNLINPEKMNQHHIEQFLHSLVIVDRVTINTQKSALNAMAFLFNQFLGMPLGKLNITRAKRGPKPPVVLSPIETKAIIKVLKPPINLVVKLLFGSGLRVNEALSVRLKDIDFDSNKLLVENAKGGKSRLTILPASLRQELEFQSEIVNRLHETDLVNGHGWAFASSSEISSTNHRLRSLPWQYLFPSNALSYDTESKRLVRYHLNDSTVQRQVKYASRQCGLIKEVTPHTFRHTFATRLLEAGVNIRIIQELLGHANVSTTELYAHVLHKHGYALTSPIDTLGEQ